MLQEISSNSVVLNIILIKNSIPKKIKKISANGQKVLLKNMPKGEYWELVQDFYCSAAIKGALDIFALLPINHCIVNVSEYLLDTATGIKKTKSYLSISFERDVLNSLNLEYIDPSDSMVNFGHQMDFKRTTGFNEIVPLNLVGEMMVGG